MSWRPEEGWENPHEEQPVVETYSQNMVRRTARRAYEAGADAGIKALVEWLFRSGICSCSRYHGVVCAQITTNDWQALKDGVLDG